jgi:hypothetical protein
MIEKQVLSGFGLPPCALPYALCATVNGERTTVNGRTGLP